MKVVVLPFVVVLAAIDMPERVADGLQAVTVALVLALVTALGRYLRDQRARDRERDRKLDKLIEIHEGAPADPITGAPAQRGMVARLTAVEAQVHNNGGSSMRDAVDRVDQRSAASAAKLDDFGVQLAEVRELVQSHLDDTEAHRRPG